MYKWQHEVFCPSVHASACVWMICSFQSFTEVFCLFVICSVTLFLPGGLGTRGEAGNFVGGYTLALLLGYSLPSLKRKLGLVVMVISAVWRVNGVVMVVPWLGFACTHTHACMHNHASMHCISNRDSRNGWDQKEAGEHGWSFCRCLCENSQIIEKLNCSVNALTWQLKLYHSKFDSDDWNRCYRACFSIF